jgi:hypothetical protein
LCLKLKAERHATANHSFNKTNKMKKQIKPASAPGGKLNLNKKTISNLSEIEMNRKIGGVRTYYHCNTGPYCGNYTNGCGGTQKGNTCYLHNTCQYTCI